MANKQLIAIAAVADAVVINAVLNAMGHGPANLSIKASTTSGLTPADASTHLAGSMQSVQTELFQQMLDFGNRDAPPLVDGYAWGEGDLPDVETALDALERLKILAFVGYEPTEQRDIAFAGHTPVLYPHIHVGEV